MVLRYDNDVRQSIFNEADIIDIDYVESYQLRCATPQDSLAKSYEMKNEPANKKSSKN